MPLQKRLVDYIYKYLNQGYPPKGIKSRLLKDGWSSMEIDEAILIAEQMVGPSQPNIPKNEKIVLDNFPRPLIPKKQIPEQIIENSVKAVKNKSRLPDLGEGPEKNIVSKKSSDKSDKKIKNKKVKKESSPKINLEEKNKDNKKAEIKKEKINVPQKLDKENSDKSDSENSNKSLESSENTVQNNQNLSQTAQQTNQEEVKSDKKSLIWIWILIILSVIVSLGVVYYLFFQ